MKFEKHCVRCTDLAAQHRIIFFSSLGRLLESAEGKGTLRLRVRSQGEVEVSFDSRISCT